MNDRLYLLFSSVGQVLSAKAKDELMISRLQSALLPLLDFSNGLAFRGISKSLSFALYILVRLIQSPGEEWVGIRMIDVANQRLASKTRRVAWLLLTLFIDWLKAKLNTFPKGWLLKLLFGIHDAWFFWEQRYPDLPCRLLSIRYGGEVSMRTRHPAYFLLALVNIAHCITDSLLENGMANVDNLQQDNLMPMAKEQAKVLLFDVECSICAGMIRCPGVLICGHCFCEGCAYAWVESKQWCPLCRYPCEPSQILVPINF